MGSVSGLGKVLRGNLWGGEGRKVEIGERVRFGGFWGWGWK